MRNDRVVRLLPLDVLSVDRSYQRKLDEKRIKKMVERWDPALVGVIFTSPGRDGTYHVYDGQHRVEAMRRLGIAEAWSQVSRLEHEDEARAFVALQTERKAVTAKERHKALLAAGDPAAEDIESMLAKYGLHWTPARSKTANGISSVQTLYNIREWGGGIEHLDRVMYVINASWKGEPTAWHQVVISGVSKFLRTYPEVDDDVLIAKLSLVSPQKILRDAVARAEVLQGTNNITEVAQQLLTQYNAGRRTRRLENRIDKYTRRNSGKPKKKQTTKA